jgi:hypothetical protein
MERYRFNNMEKLELISQLMALMLWDHQRQRVVIEMFQLENNY